MTVKRVVILLDDKGCFWGCATDDGVEVYTAQTNLSDDRIYKLTPGAAQDVNPATVDTLLAGETIGSLDDGRTEAIVDDLPKPGRLQ